MNRASWSHLPARVAALAALSALLVVPALHGTLAHGHESCDPERAAGCHVGGGDTSLGAGPGGGVCPLCLASREARRPLSAAPVEAALAGDASSRAPGLPPSWSAPSPLAVRPCAPRAPPVSA